MIEAAGRVQRTVVGITAVAVLVAAVTGAFVQWTPPREDPLALVALMLGSSVALGASMWWGWSSLQGLSWKRAAIWVLVVAALLRLVALSAPISLSDDIWRYIWDGSVVVEGESPFEESATERRERGEGDDKLYEKINRPDNQTVYPPLSQWVFAGSVVASQAVGGEAQWWLRLFFVLADLMGVLALIAVLKKVGRSVLWASVYAWHPMVYWEVGAGGHTEALGIAFLGWMVWSALRGSGLWSGIAMGCAGVVKWTFLVASPVIGIYLWVRYGIWAAIKATVAAWAVVIVSYVPFRGPSLIENQWESLKLYAEHFSYNAPLYYGMRWGLGYREGVTEPVTHITGPVMNLLLVAALLGLAWWQNGDRERLLGGVCLALGAYVVFSPVFHPWYAMPFVAAGAMKGWTMPAVVGAVSLVSYGYYSTEVGRGFEVVAMGIQVAIVTGWASWEFGKPWLMKVLRRRGEKKAEEVASYLEDEEGLRILDLGAAEGFVGEGLARRGHAVELVDIEDRNRSELEHRIYDGRRLSWPDQSFDVVVLCYVLHHADDPDAVLAEALRVGQRVVILETVYEERWDRWRTTLLDWGANMLRGLAPEPLKFDRVEGWLERIEAQGGEVRCWEWLGRGIHRHIKLECSPEERE